jgi:hypothetical protein
MTVSRRSRDMGVLDAIVDSRTCLIGMLMAVRTCCASYSVRWHTYIHTQVIHTYIHTQVTHTHTHTEGMDDGSEKREVNSLELSSSFTAQPSLVHHQSSREAEESKRRTALREPTTGRTDIDHQKARAENQIVHIGRIHQLR